MGIESDLLRERGVRAEPAVDRGARHVKKLFDLLAREQGFGLVRVERNVAGVHGMILRKACCMPDEFLRITIC